MGLLDDAIREHLELRRLRGADPGEVARKEREALGPGDRHSDGQGAVEERALGQEEASAGPSPASDDLTGQRAELSATGQETVELDMELAIESTPASDMRRQASDSRPDEDLDEQRQPPEPLEWEVPSERVGPSYEEERADEEAQAEDVLEETPDFLEETPDQERLWFEQRPPRDFDFNE